jgi:hypothetical protein
VATRRARDVVPLDSLVDTARTYASNAQSQSTARAYASDWQDFNGWCLDHGLEPLPAEPQTLSLFLTDRAATLKPSTLQRRLTAISQAHQRAGHRLDTRHPVVREVWAGIRRTHGTAQQGKAPVLIADRPRLRFVVSLIGLSPGIAIAGS